MLEEDALSWYGSRDEYISKQEPKGVIYPHDVSRVEFLPKKRTGGRLDVHVGERVYALEAENGDGGRDWADAIYQTFKKARERASTRKRRGRAIEEELDWTPSKLQASFWEAQFGQDAMTGGVTDPVERDAILGNIKAHFDTGHPRTPRSPRNLAPSR